MGGGGHGNFSVLSTLSTHFCSKMKCKTTLKNLLIKKEEWKVFINTQSVRVKDRGDIKLSHLFLYDTIT